MASPATKTYEIDGTLLEACSCDAPCPCWIGADPDGGTCDAFIAYHVDRGRVRDVDVSGLSLVLAGHIPGNVLKGNWREAVYVDDKATPAQREALLAVFTGKLGGHIADLAALITDVVGVYDVPIEHKVEGGKGTLRVGKAIYAEMAPFTDAEGRPTSLHDSVFSTIPGSPAYVAKAAIHQVNIPEHGFVWEFTGRNAVQGDFHFEA